MSIKKLEMYKKCFVQNQPPWIYFFRLRIVSLAEHRRNSWPSWFMQWLLSGCRSTVLRWIKLIRSRIISFFFGVFFRFSISQISGPVSFYFLPFTECGFFCIIKTATNSLARSTAIPKIADKLNRSLKSRTPNITANGTPENWKTQLSNVEPLPQPRVTQNCWSTVKSANRIKIGSRKLL